MFNTENPCLFQHVSKTWQPFTHDSESPLRGESESERAVDKLYLSLSCYLAQEKFILKNPPLLMIGRAQTYYMTTGFFFPP